VQRFRWEQHRFNRALNDERQARLGAQLAALQSRLSPHFLFNTVNTVASLIPTDPVLAEATLVRMASLLRYALDESPNPTVPLRRELDAVEDYLNVQCARFGDRFAWEIDAPSVVDNERVPPLALQRLVENSVVHGVGNRKSLGRILVEVAHHGEDIVCTVRDNGCAGNKSPLARGTGTALADLRESLRIHYGDRGTLTTAPLDGGYVACLRLPANV
jgi:LytS/YehU family sensor histidine kinase